MTKKILFFALPVLLAIIVLGGVDTAQAMTTIEDIEVGDGIRMTGKGEGTCTDSEGDPGTASVRVRYQMLVQEVNADGFSGIARADIALNSTCADDISLKKFGPLNFTYDAAGNTVSLTGTSVSTVLVAATAAFIDNNENSQPVKFEGTLNLDSPEGEEFIIEIEGLTFLGVEINYGELILF